MNPESRTSRFDNVKLDGFSARLFHTFLAVQGLDITGLKIAEEYRAAIEQKQIAQQQLLRAKTEVQIAEQEALKFQTLTRSLNDSVLYKLFLDKWDGKTKVVPPIRGGSTPPVIVGR